jgi:hypothetical protein
MEFCTAIRRHGGLWTTNSHQEVSPRSISLPPRVDAEGVDAPWLGGRRMPIGEKASELIARWKRQLIPCDEGSDNPAGFVELQTPLFLSGGGSTTSCPTSVCTQSGCVTQAGCYPSQGGGCGTAYCGVTSASNCTMACVTIQGCATLGCC